MKNWDIWEFFNLIAWMILSILHTVILTSHNNAPLDHIGTWIACSPGLRAITVMGSFTVRVQHIGT